MFTKSEEIFLKIDKLLNFRFSLDIQFFSRFLIIVTFYIPKFEQKISFLVKLSILYTKIFHK